MYAPPQTFVYTPQPKFPFPGKNTATRWTDDFRTMIIDDINVQRIVYLITG